MFPLHGRTASRQMEAEALTRHPPMALMFRAGAAVARLVLATARPGSPVVVVSGSGNNGGDGWVAAAHLHRAGCPVRVWEVLPARAEDAQKARAQALAAGVQSVSRPPWPLLQTPVGTIQRRGLVLVDALLGLGSHDAVAQPIGEAIGWINHIAKTCPHVSVLAVDLPSGIDADTGRLLVPDTPASDPAAVMAHHTLSLLTLKVGLFTAEGRACSGRVWFDDLQSGDAPRLICPERLGDPSRAVPLRATPLTRCEPDAAPTPSNRVDPLLEPRAFLVPAAVLRDLSGPRLLPDGAPRAGGHKGRHGDVWLLGAAAGMGGALMLASRAALAAGAGRVHRVDLDTSRPPPADPVTPEVMTAEETALARALTPSAGSGSLVIVAGCGGGAAIASRLVELLHRAPCLVLDADALNALATEGALFERLAGRARRGLRTVLTPHPLEAARLLGCRTEQVQADRLRAACTLADRASCTVVLKGAGSVVATGGVIPWVNASGNARLASGGTGDVLAGWIGGAWACQGDAHPRDSGALHRLAAACVHLHGRAAETPGADGLYPASAVLCASDLIAEMTRELMRATHGQQG
ncbi:MAG: NAD(P)H-hydrate dehydratase [Burkholderiaceae bacterium]